MHRRGHLAHARAPRGAAQRWSALVSALGSCLGRQMWSHLGTELWGEFVEHANRHYKALQGTTRHYKALQGREQPGECAGDSHDGGWR